MKDLALDGVWVVRFWSRVHKGNGCWEWTGGDRGNGYGCLRINRKLHSTHRLAWYIATGDIDPTLMICHKCDNRRCVRPDHLFLGEAVDNVRDMVAKGRMNPVRGESAPNAVLNDSIVRRIWEIRRKTGMGNRRIGHMLGVSVDAVNMVLRGINWKHLNPNLQNT